MYCQQCGKQVDNTAKFCPNCGYALGRNEDGKRSNDNILAATTQQFSERAASLQATIGSSSRTKQVLLSVWGIVLVLSGFLPWMSLDVYVASRDISFFDILTTDLTGLPESLNSVALIIIILWVIAGGVSVYNCYIVSKGKSSIRFPFIYMALLSVAAIVVLFALDAQLTGEMARSTSAYFSPSGIIAPTLWPWLAAIGSVVGGIFCDRQQVVSAEESANASETFVKQFDDSDEHFINIFVQGTNLTEVTAEASRVAKAIEHVLDEQNKKNVEILGPSPYEDEGHQELYSEHIVVHVSENIYLVGLLEETMKEYETEHTEVSVKVD